MCGAALGGRVIAGLLCAGGALPHQCCVDCARGFLESEAEPLRLRNHRGAVRCLAPGCAAPAWAPDQLLQLPHGVGRAFSQALRRLGEVEHQAHALRGVPPPQDAVVSLVATLVRKGPGAPNTPVFNEIVALLRQQIEDSVLCLTCRRCGLWIRERDGCDAFPCPRCESCVCAVCVRDCGGSFDAALAHVLHSHGGLLWRTAAERGLAVRDSRADELRQLLVDCGLGAGVGPAALRGAVLAACEPALQQVGIDPAAL